MRSYIRTTNSLARRTIAHDCEFLAHTTMANVHVLDLGERLVSHVTGVCTASLTHELSGDCQPTARPVQHNMSRLSTRICSCSYSEGSWKHDGLERSMQALAKRHILWSHARPRPRLHASTVVQLTMMSRAAMCQLLRTLVVSLCGVDSLLACSLGRPATLRG